MNVFDATIVLMCLASMLIVFFALGYFSRALYDYERGEQDGRGVKNERLMMSRCFRIVRILAWIFILIGGHEYFLGWWWSGRDRQNYNLGREVGEIDFKIAPLIGS